MQRRLSALIPLAIALWLSPDDAVRAGSVTMDCPTAGYTVSAQDPDEAARACEAVFAAERRLNALGLMRHAPLRIEVTEDLDIPAGSCVALYSSKTRKLQVLPVDCLAERPDRGSGFPPIEARLLFDSLILHELVHAFLDQTAADLTRIAHEYLAYAIQIDSLPAEDRVRILEKAGMEPPGRIEDVNEATLDMVPLRFAAAAWLHFQQKGGDADQVRRVIEGAQRFHNLSE
jgi:hypothetical protein